MSKTKEIEVCLYEERLPDLLENKQWMNVFHREGRAICASKMLKAKLIIEVPEKKVTISESEFDEMFESCNTALLYTKKMLKDALKEKLFGKER